jgi:hypothetical protein
LSKLDSFIKTLVGSIFIPILAIYIVLIVGRSIYSNPLPILVRSLSNIAGTIIELFLVYFEYTGWLASIAIFAICYIRKNIISQKYGDNSITK